MDTAPDLIDATLAHYQIEALIGQGGMGYVYRARDTILTRAVALKVLPPEVVSDASRLSRFIQEARAASALNHPHVIAIHEIREATAMRGGSPIPGLPPLHYLAMELVTGDTLRTLIDTRRLEMKRSLELMIQVADALAAAHAAGVVHRDLKPENVMIASTGYAKVLDFGLAKLRPGLPANDVATQGVTVGAASAPGILLGTVGYMSPEQVEGRATDHRSDVFSFGCLLYESVAGSRAFDGPSVIETLHRIASVDPAAVVSGLSNAPSELRRIIAKCLAKDPDDRYQSMREAAIDLRGLLRQLESGSVASPAAARPSSGSRRIMLWAAAALVLATAVAAWVWVPRRPTAEATPSTVRIERLTATGFLTHAAISPDGKYIAYTDNPGGKQGLWLRQVDGTSPLALIPPRSVGYWGVTFARDGSSIFYAVKGPEDPGGSVYQIPLLGGPSRKIVTGVDSPPSVSPDGRQLAYLRADYPEPGASAIMIANIDGANPHALAVRRPPEFFAPGFFVGTAWSPDGSRLVTAVRHSQQRNSTLITVGMKGDEAPLGQSFNEINFTSWLPDGIVFIVRGLGGLATGSGGQIWIQPYPTGAARRLTNDLIDYRIAAAGGDGKSIVSVGQEATPSLWNIPLDGKGEPQRLPSSLRYDGTGGVDWTADGHILFTTPVRGALQIWLMDADGSNRRALTTERSNGWPAMSRDGRFVAFTSWQGQQAGIWRMNPDGTDQRQLATVTSAAALDTTPDAKWITFTTDEGGTTAFWRLSSDGGTPERVVDRFERASLSPLGDRGLGVLSRDNRYGVAVLPIAGGEPMWVPSDGTAATGILGLFRWSPNGKGVYFTTAERMNLWFYQFGAPAQVRATNFTDGVIFNGAISRDGRSMIVTRGVQARDAFLITNLR